jgi:SOS-response transcriptional repressor LexA
MEIQTQKEWKTKNKLGLTPKQKIVYDIIVDFIKVNGYSPSYEELKQLINSNSKSNVHRFVHQLRKRGWIYFGKGRNRSIMVVDS